jgi:hypothetical protein
VHAWLVYQPKTFYSEVIKQSVRRWTKCIAKQGDCVEKLCSCKISALVFINMKHTVRIIIDSPSYLHAFCGAFLCVIEDFIYASVDGENLEIVL